MLTHDAANTVLYAARRGLAVLSGEASPEVMAKVWAAFSQVQEHFGQVLAPPPAPVAAEPGSVDGPQG